MGVYRRTGALAGALAMALVLAAGACGGDDDDAGDDDDEAGDATSETTSAEAEEETVFAIGEGDCVEADPTAESDVVSEVPTIDCEEPHHSEVFHTYTIDADEMPSAAEIEGIVEDQCVSEFESFVGMSYDQSALEVTWLEPTEESWEAGDRELVCLITDPAGQTTGSLEGANR
jgi:hypothetical protein